MSKFQIVGLLIIFLGIAMFLFGVSMFTYEGSLSPLVSDIGKYSFEFWLPVITFGSIFLFIKKDKK